MVSAAKAWVGMQANNAIMDGNACFQSFMLNPPILAFVYER
jgi:hypothetical protein